mmetsp:Transcript_10707/g.43940  ORF Transcript_10707/g.43940 Transcript_10707/m.43940 type:complete len:575 (-) Transcript_10707:792-2516(-)
MRMRHLRSGRVARGHGRTQLIDIGQHLGHGAEQGGGDLVVELGVRIKRPGQHRLLQHRHLALFGEVADLHGQQIGTLGHDLGRGHLALHILQRNRIVRRVHHDEVGLGHGGQHPSLGHLAHPGAQLGLDLDVAFHLLEFLLGLFPGHPQAAYPELALQRQVDGGEHRERDGQQHQPTHQLPTGIGQRRRQRHGHDADERRQPVLQDQRAHDAEHQGQQHRLERRPQPLTGEQAAQALDRVQVREPGSQRLERPVPAAAGEVAGDGRKQQQRADRPHDHREGQGHVHQPLGHEAGPGEQAGIETQTGAQHAAQGLDDLRPAQCQRGAAGQHHREMGQIARTRHLTFRPRSRDLLGRGGKVAVLCVVLGHRGAAAADRIVRGGRPDLSRKSGRQALLIRAPIKPWSPRRTKKQAGPRPAGLERCVAQKPRLASRSSTSPWLATTSVRPSWLTTGPCKMVGSTFSRCSGGTTCTSSFTRLSSRSLASVTTLATTWPVRSWKSCASMMSVRWLSMLLVRASTSLTKFITAPLATARTGSATSCAASAWVAAVMPACSALAWSTEFSTLSAAAAVLVAI